MTRLRNAIVAIALAATGFGLLGVADAPAITLHECLQETGTTAEFTSSTCKTAGAGGYHTVRLGGGRKSGKFTWPTTTTISSVQMGVEFQVSCTMGSGTAEVENVGSGASSQVLGFNIVINFESCSVTKPAGKGCKVMTETITTNALKSETPKETSKAVYQPESGETVLAFTVTGCSVTALNGEKTLKGKAGSEISKEDPQVELFNATSGSTLKLNGQTATFVAQKIAETTNNIPFSEENP